MTRSTLQTGHFNGGSSFVRHVRATGSAPHVRHLFPVYPEGALRAPAGTPRVKKSSVEWAKSAIVRIYSNLIYVGHALMRNACTAATSMNDKTTMRSFHASKRRSGVAMPRRTEIAPQGRRLVFTIPVFGQSDRFSPTRSASNRRYQNPARPEGKPGCRDEPNCRETRCPAAALRSPKGRAGRRGETTRSPEPGSRSPRRRWPSR